MSSVELLIISPNSEGEMSRFLLLPFLFFAEVLVSLSAQEE